MLNPVNSRSFDGYSAGTAPESPINNPDFTSRQGSNTFDLSAQNCFTPRFGEVSPYFYSVGVPDDRTTLQPSHSLRTYTFGSPLMSTLRMHLQNFSVPLSCIMPNSWDLIYKNPVKGSDVPDSALCSLDFFNLQKQFVAGFTPLFGFLSAWRPTDSGDYIAAFTRCASMLPYVALYYNVFSVGGLLHNLGMSVNFEKDPLDIDRRFDAAVSAFVKSIASLSGKINALSIWLNDNAYYETFDFTVGGVRKLFYRALDYPEDFIERNSLTIDSDDTSSINAFIVAFVDLFRALCNPANFVFSGSVRERSLNLFKVVSYQLICAQYFSNDKVDDIYTAKLWLQNMRGIAYKIFGSSVPRASLCFTYNGIDIEYDVFSNAILNKVVSVLSECSTLTNYAVYFLCNLFTYRRSLKYGDYFNSARTEPLAVGDVTSPVVGNKVSAIDVTKSITMQRFLNAVNRAGSYIHDYVKSIFGVRPTQVEPIPNFISRETYVIGKDEIDNTADAQGNVVTNMVDTESRFAFDIYLDTPSIILGLVSFDCIGCYQFTTEKDNFHLNRYDMFNPMLQNIGDQPVLGCELNPDRASDVNYGYQVRFAEYKFKYNQAHGGFLYNLPSWLYTFDDPNVYMISSESIRSKPADLDKFYSSLTYASTAGYFHFIISVVNQSKSNRRMQFEPTIL